MKINRPLILGYEIIIKSDHRPLTWLLQVNSPSGRIARWQLLLSEYNFTVQYLQGRENIVADFLSRIKQQGADMLEDEIESRVLAVVEDASASGSDEGTARESRQLTKFHMWSLDELIRRQKEDPVLSEIREKIDGQDGSEESKKIKGYPINNMNVEDDVLFINIPDNYNRVKKCVVVPKSYIPNALRLSHSVGPAGHGGVNTTLARCKKICILAWDEKRCNQVLF